MDPKVAKADAKHEKLHSQKRKKDSSDRKVGNEIFDKLTLETLYKLASFPVLIAPFKTSMYP